MYANTIAKVISQDGVLQGDTLAPFLFIIVIDYILRVTVEGHESLGFTLHEVRSSRLPRRANKSTSATKHITDTGYADDLSDTLEDAQTLLHRLEEAASLVGLVMNIKKTEYMCFNQDVASPKLLSLWKGTKASNRHHIPGVLGLERDLSVRIAKAWVATNWIKYGSLTWTEH